MSHIIAVRGWLECDDTQAKQIQAMLAATADQKYAPGWVAPSTRQTGSWTHYIFFGADLDGQALAAFRAQVELLAAIKPFSPDEYVRGLFLITDEQAGRTDWLIQDGQLIQAKAATQYDYLDR